MICPTCGEPDASEVLDCWRCGCQKCEDCATEAEVENQCCAKCQKEIEENGPQRP